MNSTYKLKRERESREQRFERETEKREKREERKERREHKPDRVHITLGPWDHWSSIGSIHDLVFLGDGSVG